VDHVGDGCLFEHEIFLREQPAPSNVQTVQACLFFLNLVSQRVVPQVWLVAKALLLSPFVLVQGKEQGLLFGILLHLREHLVLKRPRVINLVMLLLKLMRFLSWNMIVWLMKMMDAADEPLASCWALLAKVSHPVV